MKTVSRSYDGFAQARAAVDAIEKAGIPSSDVSLIANKHVSAAHERVEPVSDSAVGAGIGGVAGGGVGLLWRISVSSRSPGSAPWLQWAGWPRWLWAPQRASPRGDSWAL